MCEKGGENGIKDTFYRDYTALLLTLHRFSVGGSPVDGASQQWNGEVEDMASHTSGGDTVSFPHEDSHLSFCAPQLHFLIIPPPHIELTSTEAKQGQMSQLWKVGSMGAWGRWDGESENGITQQKQTFGLVHKHRSTWRMDER